MTEAKQDWRKNPRVSRKDLPNEQTKCIHMTCPHISPRATSEAVGGYSTCANPRVNKQLTDSACHKIGNKILLASFNVGD